MSFLKSPEEFQELKKDALVKLDAFISSYDEFTRQVAPRYWRSSGKFFDVKKLTDEIDDFKQCSQKDVDNAHFRNCVMTDEEQEEYNTIKNYNI